MSENNNLEKKKENPLLKGWNSFVGGIQDGFNNLQNTLQSQAEKNKEAWKENKEKAGKFFKKMQGKLDSKLKDFQTDIEQKQLESKEQWEARKQKIKDDIDKWQGEMKDDWSEGLKAWNRGIIKGTWMFLLAMIPIIVVLAIVMAIINP